MCCEIWMYRNQCAPSHKMYILNVLCCYLFVRLRCIHNRFVQGDQKVSVHLIHCIWTILTQLIWRWPSQNMFGMWTVLYWTRSLRTQFGVSINVCRLAGDTLNITCNFLYCNHQVHRDFLIILYNTDVFHM
jgi:hypothetical protein